MASSAFTRYKVVISLSGYTYGQIVDLDPDDPKVKKWAKNKFIVPLEVVRRPDAPAVLVNEPAPEKEASNETGGTWSEPAPEVKPVPVSISDVLIGHG